MSEAIYIPTDTTQDEFKGFLDKDNNNNRIFFSGSYGTGKTYFLNEFFQAYQDEYLVFHLHPVNYQIASNEHILEFLKYDIIFALMLKDSDIFEKSHDHNSLSLLPGFLKKNKGDLVKIGLSYFPKLGRPLKDIITVTQKFCEYKDQNLESKQITHYLADIKRDPRLNSETDFISFIIKKSLLSYQKKKGNKQTILVIDDLDRIDPEHIFRLLNSFMAHTSHPEEYPEEEGLKFGFDKVIFVGDEANIRSIFHHKYGENTDFKGYFDKFTSHDIYYYKSEQYIKEKLYELLYFHELNSSQSFVDWAIDIVKKLIDNNILRMRDLIQAYDREEKINLRDDSIIKSFTTYLFNVYTCGNPQDIINTLQSIRDDIMRNRRNISQGEIYQNYQNVSKFETTFLGDKSISYNELAHLVDHVSEGFLIPTGDNNRQININGVEYHINIAVLTQKTDIDQPLVNYIIDNKSGEKEYVDISLFFYDLWIEYIRQNYE